MDIEKAKAFTERMNSLDAMKREVIDSPLDDIEMAKVLIHTYGVEDGQMAYWLVLELRGAERQFMSAAEQVRSAKNDIIALKAMHEHHGC